MHVVRSGQRPAQRPFHDADDARRTVRLRVHILDSRLRGRRLVRQLLEHRRTHHWFVVCVLRYTVLITANRSPITRIKRVHA